MARFPKNPAEAQAERALARTWWRRLPMDLRARAAADLAQQPFRPFPWREWFFDPVDGGPYLDELHPAVWRDHALSRTT